MSISPEAIGVASTASSLYSMSSIISHFPQWRCCRGWLGGSDGDIDWKVKVSHQLPVLVDASEEQPRQVSDFEVSKAKLVGPSSGTCAMEATDSFRKMLLQLRSNVLQVCSIIGRRTLDSIGRT